MPPHSALTFDEENAVWYVFFIAMLNVGMTYIEATHSIGRGILAGAAGVVMMLIVGWIVNRSVR